MSNPRAALDTIGHYLLLTLPVDDYDARRELRDTIENLKEWCDQMEAKTRHSSELGGGYPGSQ